MTDDTPTRVQYLTHAHYEAQFGPPKHVATIAPLRPKTPAYLALPDRFDDAPPIDLKLLPTDPPPEAA